MLHQGKAPSPCPSVPCQRADPGRGSAELPVEAGGKHTGTRLPSVVIAVHPPGDTRRAEPPRPGFRSVVPHGRSWRRDGRLKRSHGAAERSPASSPLPRGWWPDGPRRQLNFAESFLLSGTCSHCCFHQHGGVGVPFISLFVNILLFIFIHCIYWRRSPISR